MVFNRNISSVKIEFPTLADGRTALAELLKVETELHHFSQKDYTKEVNEKLDAMDNKLSVLRSYLDIQLRNPEKKQRQHTSKTP